MNIPRSSKRKSEEISENLVSTSNKSKESYWWRVWEVFRIVEREDVMPHDVSNDILLVYL